MKFLNVLGKVIITGLKVVVGLQGAGVFTGGAATTVTRVKDDLTQLSAVIAQAEVMGQVLNLPGEDKLKAVAPLVGQIILGSAALAQHKVAQPDLFLQGTTKITSGWADVLNSLEPQVETIDRT